MYLIIKENEKKNKKLFLLLKLTAIQNLTSWLETETNLHFSKLT